MKILYVSTISDTIDAFLIPHIKFLVEQGNKVDVACNIKREIRAKLVEQRCQIYNVKFQRSPIKKENYIAYKKIKKIVLEEKYELVHTHTPIASFITRIACRNITNLKIVYTTHGFHFFKGAPLKNWLIYYPIEKLAAKWTDCIITINKEDYAVAKKMKMRKQNSVFLIHGVGIDLNEFSYINFREKDKFRKKYGYSIDEFILFYAAELNDNKHQDLLIKTVYLIKSRGINAKLLLAGTGDLYEQYRKQVDRLGLQNNVIFLGFREDIANLLKISDIVVASSKREGLPVNVMEAMVAGLPLVVTDCRGQRDLVNNNENGYIIGINNIVGFADAVERLYYSVELRKKFGERSLGVIKRYSIEDVLKELKEVYLIL